MALMHKVYEAELTELKKEICRNPDADFTPRIKELAAEIVKQGNKREKNFKKQIVETLLLDLYSGDAEALERDIMKRAVGKLLLGLYGEDDRTLMTDITKVMMLGTHKAERADIRKLFPCICDALSLRTKEDFADTIEMCTVLKEAREAEDA